MKDLLNEKSQNMWSNISMLIVGSIIFLQKADKNFNKIKWIFEMVHNLNKMCNSGSIIF